MSVSEEISRFLRQNRLGRPFETAEVVNFLRDGPWSCVRKKEINSILYELHGRGELVRVSMSPPVWLSHLHDRSLVLGSSCASFQTDMFDDRGGPVRSDGGVGRRDLAEDVLNIMSQLQPEESIHPRTLAKRLRLCSKSDVNPVLYLLQKEGKLLKVADCPPLWKRGSHPSSMRPARTTPSESQVETMTTEEHSSVVDISGSAHSDDGRVSFLRNAKLDDELATLVTDAFDTLREFLPSSDYDFDDCGRRSIAAFVVQSAEDFIVVALGTGSCDISREQQQCSDKMRLEDHRAEVVARQSFKRFLCRELTTFHRGNNSTVLERCRDKPAMLKLKDGVSISLYIYNNGTTIDGNEDVKSRCAARTPKSNRCAKTKNCVVSPRELDRNSNYYELKLDGSVLCSSGRHFRQKCCPDKVAKWNVVGLQGALLSIYLSPVYLDSVTIGSPSGDEYKAYLTHWQLLANKEPSLSTLLPHPFNVNVSKLGTVSSQLSSTYNGFCCTSSTNWSLGDPGLEVIDHQLPSRLDPGNGSSRLCKRNTFKEFLFLCQLTGRHDLFNLGTYLQCKRVAMDFLLASDLFGIHFRGN